MTVEEAQELVPEVDYVVYRQVSYLVASVYQTSNNVIIGVYNDSSSKSIDYVGISVVSKSNMKDKA